jgi:hypothetical protein
MTSHPISAIVLYCNTCGLIRIGDNYPAAHARAIAHTQLSGHAEIEYAILDDPDRLRVAEAFERRSARRVNGYVEDQLADALEGLTGEDTLIEAAIRDFTVGR